MSVVAEKMRQMRSRLKSAGERLREYARFPGEPGASLRARAEALRECARAWRARPEPIAEDAAEAPPPLSPGERFWPQPAPADTYPPHDVGSTAEYASDIATDAPGERDWTVRDGLRIAGIALIVFLALPYFLIPFFRFIDPPFSALMARQFLTGTAIRHEWVNLEDISPALPVAVVISEDSAFCRHWGVDWNAVGDALDEAENGDGIRGASTIPMQTAKNLFLWNGFSFVRKVLEVPLAYYISLLWPKQRVMEVYLNIAEWGPGIFGAEAASRYHFRKSAAQLTSREAALLAASLPSPIKRKAGRPNGQTARIAAHIQARVGREGQDAACVLVRDR